MQEKLSNKAKDLAGMRFGKLTALSYVGSNKQGYPVWRCRCDCGNEIDVARPSLTSVKGRKSCGCLSAGHPALDLTDMRFGKLTALERLDEKKDRTFLWRCRCDCGNELTVKATDLTNGRKTHCGCQRKTTGAHYRNLAGMRFGMLTALEPCGKDQHGNYLWRCRCDCGNETLARATRLINEETKSCGCMSRRRT